MYARKLRCGNQKWDLSRQPSKYINRPICQDNRCLQASDCTNTGGHFPAQGNWVRINLLNSFSSRVVAPDGSHIGLHGRYSACWKSSQLRLYSSEGDGRNASEDKHTPVEGGGSFDDGKTKPEKLGEDVKLVDEHARLGEQDQQEWLNNEKLAMDRKKKESPFLPRREKFKHEFLQRVIPWEKITVTWETFPYFMHEHTKNLLVECAASHLKHKKYTATYGARLTSSSGRILLQSVPGTELYRERLVRALARDLEVPLLVLDSSVLAPYDFGDECVSESESDDESAELEEGASSDGGDEDEDEDENENEAGNEEDWTSNGDHKSESSDDDTLQASAKVLKKLVPPNMVEEFERVVAGGDPETSTGPSKSETVEPSDASKEPLKKGDRVKYTGPSVHIEADSRSFLNGQRGEVYEVNGDRVAVIFEFPDNKAQDVEKDDKHTCQTTKPSVFWIHVKEIERDVDTESEDCYVAIKALHEVLQSMQPIIVYFPDSSEWLSRAVPKSNRKEFVHKLQEMFDQLSGPVVLICGKNKVGSESESKGKQKFQTMILPNLGRLASKLPLPLRRLTEGLKSTKKSGGNDIHQLFNNVLCIYPPKEEDLLQTFNKQVEEDRRIVISRSNLNELHKVLDEHELTCTDLLHLNTDGLILTRRKAEKVIGWAKNHYLSSCGLPSIKGERLQISKKSLETTIMRLKEQDTISKKPSHNLKNLAKDEYEKNFISAVVPPGEIGVKFNDVGALEEVKKALNELVILPMKRPELFSHGNLLRPCKGILLFGPPGTGKTLLAKALATEAGANFISITGSTLTSKWFGDAEKLTKSLFSFASKLAPVIIFVDEVDSLLGARGGAFEHEATRRMRNEFMAAWDGLRTKDSQRILILGATNRPFDLDDAVIRRLPRRIHVDLPDAENRMKILKIFLANENIDLNFEFDELANATEGYSGSDLKNLCIAAAYRPVQELLEREAKESRKDVNPILRRLKLEDFLQSKAKVGPSVSFDAASMNELRKWNEQYGEGGSRSKTSIGFP